MTTTTDTRVAGFDDLELTTLTPVRRGQVGPGDPGRPAAGVGCGHGLPGRAAGREQVREMHGADRAPPPAQAGLQLAQVPGVDRDDVVDPGGLVRVQLRGEDAPAVARAQ